jgi:hypothetical protein
MVEQDTEVVLNVLVHAIDTDLDCLVEIHVDLLNDMEGVFEKLLLIFICLFYFHWLIVVHMTPTILVLGLFVLVSKSFHILSYFLFVIAIYGWQNLE